MNNLSLRINNVCQELTEIQEQLNWAATNGTGGHALTFEEVCQFKDTVDALRQFLRAYIERLSQPADNHLVQADDPQHDTEMPTSLHDELDHPALQQAPEARTFFSEIQNIATGLVERYMPKPSESSE